MSSAPDVVSLTAHRNYRPHYRSLACEQVRAARVKLGLGHDGFAAYLGSQLGRKIPTDLAKRWEHGNVPPGDVLLACDGETPAPGLLETVPHAFTAATLAGAWLTCYQFSDPPKHHADIAAVTATSDRHVRVTNHAPVTEGHTVPYRNEIDADVAGRQVVGTWKNVSDACYFGTVHLAVLPGETVMEGFHTGLTRDGVIATGFWKWARLDLPEGTDLAAVTLHDPAGLFALAGKHTPYDAPLTLAAVGEEG